MWNDPVVDEVRRARDELARKFDYQLDAILNDAMRRQTAHGAAVVRREPRPPRNVTTRDPAPAPSNQA